MELFSHCTSSTTSRLACTMNWFMYRLVSVFLNRAMPSPPCFEVPNVSSKTGESRGERMAK